MAVSRRDHLVNTALQLFYDEGFHATGIDRILAQAGVAKMTLYKYFKSKDELILATLRRRDERFRNWFVHQVEGRAQTANARLLALFDVYDDWLHSDDSSHGCLFINATAEFAAEDNLIHVAAAETKRLVLSYVMDLATAAGAQAPQTLATQLVLLLEGATVMAQVTGDRDAIWQAKKAAVQLVETALMPRADSTPMDAA